MKVNFGSGLVRKRNVGRLSKRGMVAVRDYTAERGKRMLEARRTVWERDEWKEFVSEKI